MNDIASADNIERALSLLSAVLEDRGVAPIELVVIGGAAMIVLGIGVRPTSDVDVLAFREADAGNRCTRLIKRKPLPEAIASAALVVAEALSLDPAWLNTGPADLLDWGLPDGFEGRLSTRRYGSHLAVLWPSREDLICFKVYAAADTGVGRHTEDLAALQPTAGELRAGARWAAQQDSSDDFRVLLSGLMRYLGHHDVAKGLGDGY